MSAEATQSAASPIDVAKMAAGRTASRLAAKNVARMVAELLPGLSPAIRDKVAARAADMPERHRLRYIEAMGGKSRRAAVEAQCWECCGWEVHPSGCTAPACPLFQYRPGI